MYSELGYAYGVILLLCAAFATEEEVTSFVSQLDLFTLLGRQPNIIGFFGVCVIGGK